eukprot:CAMPEP_0114620836 /NCGR_PEP_ID=MMETSP0168-20121206/8927_1 /TAXON_ID=95228 ORGANISM="Vannella sp., Strain DIVA3 517/6/12" /NCGR_SAMPLE_ID=MMETSP0168 /ASSEMBLY_ACC=CAM_ASM_000044 /LENGTH=182 /DNA_ID=CAMNT_0001832033 /DNA_START=41 /DNA_END=587 /DNA_ORIENTATION=-
MAAALPSTNPRGIPATKFIESVADFLKDEESADAALKKMNEAYGTYKYLEEKLAAKKQSLKKKIPEMKKTREAVLHLLSQKAEGKEIQAQFELSDHVYTNATISGPENVCLWLGANVMVEYPIEDALAVLEGNLATAQEHLGQVTEDLQFLKAQITTVEVNIARVFNHDVKARRRAREAASE